MSASKSSYREIVKTTTLFGGVQFFNIIISIIRTKLIAIFIGPTGMGMVALLNSTINIISGVSGLGLETSGVKHISESYNEDDINSVSKNVSIIKKLAFFTGVLGALLLILFSSLLSELTFGNRNHQNLFIFLSVTLLFKQLMTGQLVILQGLRKFRYLAKANFYGNLFGLLFSIPLYYYYKIDAIVPTIIIASFVSMLVSFFYSNKIKIKKSKIQNKELIIEGKSIIKLGIMLTISGLITLIATYLIQLYVGRTGGLEEVGFYNAGFMLLNSYVGIIFTVMSTDYFPRLAAICNENDKVRTSVIQQSFVSILIITPIIVLFLTFIPFIIPAIFSSKFTSVIPMVTFGILAMLFRAVSWSMGYILLAKGDSKMFIRTAFGFNIISLLLNVLGYYFYGLQGLGISFFIYYLIHFFALKIITKKRYDFYFDNNFYQVYLVCIMMCGITFLFTFIEIPVIKYSLMSLMILCSFTFVIYHFNKKMELKELFNSILKKK